MQLSEELVDRSCCSRGFVYRQKMATVQDDFEPGFKNSRNRFRSMLFHGVERIQFPRKYKRRDGDF